MEAMRQSWGDDRLDGFAAETRQRFEDVDRRLGEVNGRLDRLGDRVEVGFDRINDRIDHLHRSIWILGSGALVTLVVGFAGIIIGQ